MVSSYRIIEYIGLTNNLWLCCLVLQALASRLADKHFKIRGS